MEVLLYFNYFRAGGLVITRLLLQQNYFPTLCIHSYKCACVYHTNIYAYIFCVYHINIFDPPHPPLCVCICECVCVCVCSIYMTFSRPATNVITLSQSVLLLTHLCVYVCERERARERERERM